MAIYARHSFYSLAHTGDEVGEFVSLSVNLADGRELPPRAREVVDTWVAQVKSDLAREFPEKQSEELAKLREPFRSAEARFISLQGIADELQQRALNGITYVSMDRSNVEEQIRSTKLDLELAETRVRLLTMEIAKRSDTLENVARRDPIVAELQKVVDLREEKLRRLRDARQPAEPEIDSAITDLAEARAQLAEVMRSVVSEIGGTTLTKLNVDLLESELHAQELPIRLEHLSSRLRDFDDRDRLWRETESVVVQGQHAQNAAQRAFLEYRAALNARVPNEDIPTELFVISRSVGLHLPRLYPAAR